jgi:DNA-binding MarR family transcriptional regulator
MPPRGAKRSKSVLAREAWREMFDFFMQTAPARQKAIARRGLTPNDSRALATLSATDGRTMRSLADEWQCDASNATWIVDRLEGMGLVRRMAMLADRRVKLVLLTPKGVKVKSQLLEEFHDPPEAVRRLSQAELEQLSRAMANLRRRGKG